MTLTNEISQRLNDFVRSSPYDIVIPNFYHGQWEMDLFKMTVSGLVYEYEIKVSLSDFKRDFDKKCHKGNKHELIENGKRVCNRFYFVCPAYLISVIECPVYAGLIYYQKGQYFSIVKNAPMLHKNKEIITYKELASRLSFREGELRRKLRRLKEN